jgi:uncharacterized protein (DUF1800 family)
VAAADAVADTRSRIALLYRRAAFGARPDELDAATAAGYDATVDQLIAGATATTDPGADETALPSFAPPLRAAQLPSDPQARRAAQLQEQKTQRDEAMALGQWWLDRMVTSTAPLRERLTLFWHGHFATSVQKVKLAELMYRQNQIFRTKGSGSFETLAQTVATDPAMLIWLDANDNRAQSPNENFAREFFELFTLGIGNYSEADIKNAARAFTGWQYRPATDTVALVPSLHDGGTKTVLGQTANLGGPDVITLAVREPASAAFVASKLWSHFARPATSTDPVVKDLAAGYARDLDLANLLRAIFRHPEFTATATRTGLVKEPIAYVAGTLRALGLRAASPGVNAMATLNALGQAPLAPPNVGGWPQNGYWLTTSFALTRLRFATAVVQRADLGVVTSASTTDRPAAAARLLGIEGWGSATAGALTKAAGDPKAMMSLALVSPEYLLA